MALDGGLARRGTMRQEWVRDQRGFTRRFLSVSDPSGPSEHGPSFHARNVGGERTPRRAFSAPSKSRVKDRDLHQVGVNAAAVAASLLGAIMGVALGFFMMSEYGFGLWVIPTCMVGMGLFVGSLTLMVAGGVGASVKTLNPSGSSTPHKKEYSYAESLVMRGMYEDAVSAFELVVVDEKSTDPTPFLRIARIYRDHLERYEDAARWLKRALAESDMHRGLRALTLKELVELYSMKLNMPEKAAPMLARIAQELEGTPDGDWAAEELRQVKQMMWEREN